MHKISFAATYTGLQQRVDRVDWRNMKSLGLVTLRRELKDQLPGSLD